MKEKEYLGAYTALGSVFEYLNDDCGYEKWSQYLIEKLRSLGIANGARGLDVGCGNGYFTRAFYKAGFDVWGADISPQMLNTAVELARKEGAKIEFLQQDITKLKLESKCDFITAVNDCINYVPKDKLCAAFKKVYAGLKSGGVFIFDISTEHKLKEIIGNNVFCEDREDISYMWFNTLKEDSVEMEITLFSRGADGRYTRLDERQTQYIYGANEILTALKQAGFAVQSEGHLGNDDIKRINFICRK